MSRMVSSKTKHRDLAVVAGGLQARSRGSRWCDQGGSRAGESGVAGRGRVSVDEKGRRKGRRGQKAQTGVSAAEGCRTVRCS